MDTPDDKEYFALYSADCMNCTHLAETGTVAFDKCHYTKGNKLCPAAEVKLVVVGQALKYARRVLRARDKRDAAAEGKLMKFVGRQSDAFKSKFYDYLENGGRLIIKRGE